MLVNEYLQISMCRADSDSRRVMEGMRCKLNCSDLINLQVIHVMAFVEMEQ